MPLNSTFLPSFVRPAEIMGGELHKAFSTHADEVAALIKKGDAKSVKQAKIIVAQLYDEDDFSKGNTSRLVRAMNRGADEVLDSSLLKRDRKRLDGYIANIQGTIKKSADRYLDRIVMPKVLKLKAKGASSADIEAMVKKSMDGSGHYWKNVSNTGTSRISNYGAMVAAERAGLTKCTYENPMDEDTSDFCENIHGKTITLSNAMMKAEQLLEQSPDEMLDTNYFEIADELGKAGSLAIVRNGITLPPFHGHCRTKCIFS